jgi:hypothetical protein
MPIVFMPQHREYWDYFSFRSPRVVAEREHWLACFKDFLQKITFAAATRSARQPQQAKTSDATAAADADAQRKEQRREQPQPPPPPQQQQQQQQRRQRRLLLKSPCHTARVELLLAEFPDAQFIYLHRDPCVPYFSCCCPHNVSAAAAAALIDRPSYELTDLHHMQIKLRWMCAHTHTHNVRDCSAQVHRVQVRGKHGRLNVLVHVPQYPE